METLALEGRAIFDTMSSASAAQHEQQKKEIDDLIAQAIKSAVDKAVGNMQMYADGVESTLQQHITELREQVGLATHSDDLGGDTETGPDGGRSATTTRRPAVGATSPYIPPPARGIRTNRTSVHAPRSFDVHGE